MMTVFLTGASGFVGRAVVARVLRDLGPNDRLLVLVRTPLVFADPRVATVRGNLHSLSEISAWIRQAQVIIHLAGEARMCTGQDYSRLNVAATEQLVAIAQTADSLRRFIFVSSVAAMDRGAADRCTAPLTVTSPCHPRTEYGKSKLLAEQVILQSRLPYTIFRPGFIYGPGMRDDSHLRKFARCISNRIPLHRVAFPGNISLIHVDDLATGIARCLTGDLGLNRIYLAETEFMALGDALSLLGEALLRRKSWQIPVLALRSVCQRFHSALPVVVAGLFLDYYRMDDRLFRKECLAAARPKLLAENIRDIVEDSRD